MGNFGLVSLILFYIEEKGGGGEGMTPTDLQ